MVATRYFRILTVVWGVSVLVIAAVLVLSTGRMPRPGGAAGDGDRSGATSVDLEGAAAPGFRLTDQSGRPVALSDLRGKVVVLSFLYTSCPDVCPLIAQKMGRVRDALGERAAGAAFVVISVDPERDTPARIRQYLEAQGLAGKLLYLTGDRAELERVWKGYHAGVRKAQAATSSQDGPGFYDVIHLTSLYIIDTEGRERSLVDDEASVEQLVKAIDALLPAGGTVSGGKDG